jgi:hypothetical protein
MLRQSISLSIALLVLVTACRKSSDAASGSTATSVSSTSSSSEGSGGATTTAAMSEGRGDDPCIYIASTEAEAYVGPLSTPPFRYDESDGIPDVRGQKCMYRGRDGREITIDLLLGGAKMAVAVTAGVPRVVGRMAKATGHGDLQGVTDAVTQKGDQGPWDTAQWSGATGTLIAVKGDSGVILDVSTSNAGEQGADVLARDALSRIAKPLEYDGAHAAALAPKPRTPLANACDLIPRARVEQAIGKLASDPQRDTLGASCTYRVAGANGAQEYPLDITWVNGSKQFAMEKGAVGAAPAAAGLPTGGGMPTLPPEAQKMLGQIGKMTGGALAAPSSLVHGPPTDTTFVGPWDHAGMVGGSTMIATRHNVMIEILLTSGDYDKAKALLAAACEQL